MALFIASFEFGSPAYDESICLRYDLLKQPLGINFEQKEILLEYQYHHLGAYNEHQKLIACLMLVPLEKNTFHMRQVAVAEAFQSRGIGSQLVRASEQLAKALGGTKMILNARDTAITFYKKLDYEVVGDEFVEVGIPHYMMEKEI